MLGENTRLAARPVLLAERELYERVATENSDRDRQRRISAKAARHPKGARPQLFETESEAVAARASAKPTRGRGSRRSSKVARSAEATPALTLFDIEPERVVETAAVDEIVDVESERVVQPELVAAEPAAREVVVPEIIETEATARIHEAEGADERAGSGQHLFSERTRGVRVKKIQPSGRKGWIVDYVDHEREVNESD